MNLQEAAEELGLEAFEYSGRGMYGKKCLAIRSEGEVIRTVFRLGCIVGEDGIDWADQCRYDNFGHGYVIYFPGIPFEEPGSDEDDGK